MVESSVRKRGIRDASAEKELKTPHETCFYLGG